MIRLFNRKRRLRSAGQVKLTDSGAASGDYFGYSVALSSDGNTALVGAYGDTVTYANQGSAVVFTKSGNTWTQQAKLTDSSAASGDYFGYSVALSSDGNTALVGVIYDDVTYSDQGSAVVFTRSGGTWSQQAKLTDSSGFANDYFGISVALSSDGNTALVGAYGDDETYSGQGSAIVFTRTGSTWSQQAKLTDSGGAANDFFGTSVALSSDGNTALVGAFSDDVTYPNQGSAIVFTRTGSTWSQQAKLTDSGGAAYDQFGRSVALSSDGDTALVGVYTDYVTYPNQGSAVVFTRTGSTWTQQAKLTDSSGASDNYFGYSVDLSSDGDTALVGAYGDTVTYPNQGSAIVFTRSGSTWTQQARLKDNSGAINDYFGYSVALSSDANTALVGVIYDDVTYIDQGSAVVFYRR